MLALLFSSTEDIRVMFICLKAEDIECFRMVFRLLPRYPEAISVDVCKCWWSGWGRMPVMPAGVPSTIIQ